MSLYIHFLLFFDIILPTRPMLYAVCRNHARSHSVECHISHERIFQQLACRRAARAARKFCGEICLGKSVKGERGLVVLNIIEN